jgi:hypothetical protein
MFTRDHQLMEENLTWLGMESRCIPSMIDHLMKPGEPKPKILERKSSRLPQAAIIG